MHSYHRCMEERGRERTAEVASRVVAAIIGVGIGGVGGAIAGAALEPAISRLVQESLQEFSILRQRSVGIMAQDAAERLGLSVEELLVRARSSEERTQLLADAMYQAALTFNLRKVKALGRAVANGLRDDEARPDQELLIVSALASIDEPHVKVLMHLPERRTRPRVTSLSHRVTYTRRGARLPELIEESGLTYETAEHVLAELIRTGMAHLDNDAENSRHDLMIVDLRRELNELQRHVQRLHQWARQTTTSAPNPPQLRHFANPEDLPEPGYVITSFGAVCLSYLLDQTLESTETEPEPEPAASAEEEFLDPESDAPWS